MNRYVPTIAVGAAVLLLGLWSNQDSGDSLLDGALGLGQPVPGAEVEFGELRIDGAGKDSTTVVGNGGSAVLNLGYTTRWADGVDEPSLHLSLERKSGQAWEPVSGQFSQGGDDPISVHVPAWSTTKATEAVRYRVVSTPYVDGATGGVADREVSPSITVQYENQSFYTGLAARAYKVVKPYCPTSAVHVRGLDDDEAGLFSTGSQLIEIDRSVRHEWPVDIRAVALHECSHERQWMNYGSTLDGSDRMEADAKAIFTDWRRPAGEKTAYPYWRPDGGKIDPVEHAADCGAQAVNPGGYLGYGGYCSPEQLEAGERLLRGETY